MVRTTGFQLGATIRATLQIAALLASMLLVACGGSSAETPTATSETANAATTAPSSATEGRRVAQAGDSVQVHYEGTLDDGEVFDSSKGRDPLPFVVGSGQVIPGFDAAVIGLAVGESRKVRLEPADAYGERRDDLVLEVPAEQAPPGLSVGDQVQLQSGAVAVVEAVTAETVTIDANHPLAGQALTFEIELVAIN